MDKRLTSVLVLVASVLHAHAAAASRFIDPPLDSGGSSPFFAGLINASPILVLGLVLLFVARWQNILRFFGLWLGLAWFAHEFGLQGLAMGWVAFGWLVLFFLADHWLYRPEGQGGGEKMNPGGQASHSRGAPALPDVPTQSLPKSESQQQTPAPASIQKTEQKVVVSCPECAQRMRVPAGKHLSVTCFACRAVFPYNS